MYKVEYRVKKDLEPYINCIMCDESEDVNSHTKIPIFADGYPGIMFQQSDNGFYRYPKGKELSAFFLYGQTLNPISLEAKGKHKFIVFQLYPFASKYLLGVDPKTLNDDCYDLLAIKHIAIQEYLNQLSQAQSVEEQIDIISEVLLAFIQGHKAPPNDQIQEAIALIIDNNGIIKINDLSKKVYMSERSFERKFKAQVGLGPKQFAKIIQFQKSLSHLTQETYEKLTNVGLESGFADQSHFIKTFKNYTGQTPSFYLRQLNA